MTTSNTELQQRLIDNRRTRSKTLDLNNLSLTEIPNLSQHTWVTELRLNNNKLHDISALSSLTDLTNLRLNKNLIKNIDSLAGLTNLTHLWLSINKIKDLSSLSRLTNLTELLLDNNDIRDIGSLSGLTNLTELRLNNNLIENIDPLAGLTNLTYLWLYDNFIRDFSALSSLHAMCESWLGLGSGKNTHLPNTVDLTNPTSHDREPQLQTEHVSIKTTSNDKRDVYVIGLKEALIRLANEQPVVCKRSPGVPWSKMEVVGETLQSDIHAPIPFWSKSTKYGYEISVTLVFNVGNVNTSSPNLSEMIEKALEYAGANIVFSEDPSTLEEYILSDVIDTSRRTLTPIWTDNYVSGFIAVTNGKLSGLLFDEKTCSVLRNHAQYLNQ
jgi:hypothetical protein